jgi:hypothetical protein
MAMFLAVWFGVTILTSVGASDHSPAVFLTWMASVAALTLAFQPGVIFWLFTTSRIWGSSDAAAAAGGQDQGYGASVGQGSGGNL